MKVVGKFLEAEAVQYIPTGGLLAVEFRAFIGKIFNSTQIEGWGDDAPVVVRLRTSHGELSVRPYDWVVRWPTGDSFTYEIMNPAEFALRLKPAAEELLAVAEKEMKVKTRKKKQHV